MKHIQSIIVSALLLAVWLPAHAQFAGPDKKVLKTENNNQGVSIGMPAKSNKECFEWSGPHIKPGDERKAVITVYPQSTEEIYIVKKTDDCMVEWDQVKVTLVDTVSLVSVRASKCYNDGDSIKSTDFDIVTDPPGYESMVTVTPIIANHMGTDPEWRQAVNFRLTHHNHTSHKSTTVSVISEQKPLNVTFTPEFQNFEKNIRKAEEILDMALAVKKGLLNLSKGSPIDIDCDPSWSTTAALPTFSCYCCQGKKVETFNLLSWGLSGSIGCEAAIPIPAASCPIPCAKTGLMGVVGFSGGLSLGPTNIVWREKCSYIEVQGELNVEIHGGFRVQALSKDFLSLSAVLYGSAIRHFSWKVGDPFVCDDIKLKFGISGEVKTFSWVTIPYDIPIGEIILNH